MKVALIYDRVNEASPPMERRGFSFEKGSRFAGKAAILASFIHAHGGAEYSEARNKIGGATRQTGQPRLTWRRGFCKLRNMAYNFTSESSTCIRPCQ